MKRLLMGLALLASPVLAADGYEQLVSGSAAKVVEIQVRGIGEYLPLFATGTVVAPMMVTGSGSFISSEGHILTCHHLFDPEMKDMVITVKASNGSQYRGFLIGKDREKDLALLKVFPLHKQPYFTLGKAVKQGQRVLSFGSPLGIEKTVTVGYVSNANASQHRKNDNRAHIMHTASINPGNSGGPLVNTNGELVGVNVATYMADIFSTAEGMHLAVTLKDINTFLGAK